MEIRRIDVGTQAVLNTAPKYLKRFATSQNRENLCLGGEENGRIVAYAFFSRSLFNTSNDIHLKYLYTLPEYRMQGKCTMLMEKCARYLAGLGITNVFSRYYIRYEHAEAYNTFIQNKLFVPLNLTSRLLYYRAEALKSSGTLRFLAENRKMFPPFSDYRSIEKSVISEFLKKHERNQLSATEIGGHFSRFYVVNGRIEAALLAGKLDDKSLYISSVYQSEEAKKKNLFVILFADCHETTVKLMGPDTDIYLQVEDEASYQGLYTLFDPPEEELLILEHILKLK